MTNKTRGTLSADLAAALSRLAAQGRSVFTVGQFARAAGRSPSQAWRVLNFLLEGGWIVRLSRGTYLIVPLEAGPAGTWAEDSLVVASHLADPAAVAYWSACHYWNWTEQVPRTVFVQTPRRVRPRGRTVLGVRYQFICVQKPKFFGTTDHTTERGRFTVTDREKTLVDALDRPDLCGGIGQVLAMLPVAAEAVRWDRMDAYLERMGSGAVYKRLGYLIETRGRNVHVPDRDNRLDAWQSRLTGGYAPLEPGGGSAGPLHSRWRLRLNVPGLGDNAGTP